MDKIIYQKFKDYLELNHQSNAYLSFIANYLKHIEEKKIDINSITEEQLNEYLHFKKDLSSSGINNYIKALRYFYKFLNKELPLKMKLLKEEKKIPIYITKEELEKIINHSITYLGDLIYPIKVKALLYFLFYTGVRKGEFLKFKREDINLKERIAIVRLPTKSGKERVVLFPRKVRKVLETYFHSEQEDTNAFNITASKLTYLIKRMNEFINKKISMHSFRHSFGMYLAEVDIGIKKVKELMGHQKLETTEIYFNPTLKTIKTDYDKKVK